MESSGTCPWSPGSQRQSLNNSVAAYSGLSNGGASRLRRSDGLCGWARPHHGPAGWMQPSGLLVLSKYVDQLGHPPVVTCQRVTWEKRHQFWAWQTGPSASTALSELRDQALPGDPTSLSLSVLTFKMGTSLSFQLYQRVSRLARVPGST